MVALQDGADLDDGSSGRLLLAGDELLGVDLAHLPVGVLVVGGLALEIKSDAALGLKATTLLEARPALGDAQLAGRSAEVEARRVAIDGGIAVVDHGSVEEVIELGGRGAADGAVVEDGVLEGEVGVAPGVLVRRGGEGV